MTEEYLAYAVVAGALFFVLIAGLVMKRLHRRSVGTEFDKQYYSRALLRAAQSLRVRDVGPRLAVIDAAKLLDEALRHVGVAGDNSADRIRNYKDSLVDANKIWSVNKEYERMIQEPEGTIDLKRARNAVKAVETELNKLGAL